MEIEELKKKVKEQSLGISRVPKETKKEFVAYANSEFCGDYGMTLKYIWDNFKIGKIFIENLSYKLDEILRRVEPSNEESPEQEEGITLLSGRKVEKGGKTQNGKFK